MGARGYRDVQYVVLSTIATMAEKRPEMFRPFIKDFYVHTSDAVILDGLCAGGPTHDRAVDPCSVAEDRHHDEPCDRQQRRNDSCGERSHYPCHRP